jgi:hypothetical protein
VAAHNVGDVVLLALLLQEYGVAGLKFHHPRPVGNAAMHEVLFVTSRIPGAPNSCTPNPFHRIETPGQRAPTTPNTCSEHV